MRFWCPEHPEPLGCPPNCGNYKIGFCEDLVVLPALSDTPEFRGDVSPKEKVRSFPSGATRSADLTRDDPEGFLSPLAIDRYCEYMTKHRTLPDGSLRDSDNWQKGLPSDTFMKGILRHVLHAWTRHRGYAVRDPLAAADLEEDLCALMFNAQAWLHELVKARQKCPTSSK